MKKYIILAAVSVLALPLFSGATITTTAVQAEGIAKVTDTMELFNTTLRKGITAPDVSTLQTILKTDPTIYPGGLVTGYYGPATETAVKKLQSKYNLPQTGVVDKETQSVIYPDPSTTKIEIMIVVPNGGETWAVGSAQKILWKSSIGPIIPMMTPGVTMNDTAGSSAGTTGTGMMKPTVMPMPFFPYASIDLVRDSQPSYSYHIGSANLYQTQYSWYIPKNVPEASDYRIKISVGKNVPCLYRSDVEAKQSATATSLVVMPDPRCAAPMVASFASDISDNVFTIKGGNAIDTNTVAELRSQIAQIKMMIEKLTSQIAAIEAKLRNM